MASQLTQLKGRIDALASQTRQTSQNLGGFEQTFRRQVGEVQQAIGGSAQRKDQEVVESLSNASRKVQEAVAALDQAARVSTSYAASL